MKEQNNIHFHFHQNQEQLILIREKESFLITLAKLIAASINEDDKAWHEAFTTLQRGGWNEYMTTLDGLWLSQAQARGGLAHRYMR